MRGLPAVLRQDWDSGLFLEVHCDIHSCLLLLFDTDMYMPLCARHLATVLCSKLKPTRAGALTRDLTCGW
jgi:hypothetical protein